MSKQAHDDFKEQVEAIRRPGATAEQKKTAATIIGLLLLQSQIGAGGNLNFAFDPNNSENFADTVAKIQDAITRI